MGQAKLRKAEIEQLKNQNPNKQKGDDLNNYFYSLGDGKIKFHGISKNLVDFWFIKYQ